MDETAKMATLSGSAGIDPLIGQVLAGKYTIEKLLGKGGMGAVYEGRHLALDRVVAIKVMRGQLVEDERAVARFLREARASAKIEHPNAVTIHDFGVIEGQSTYIVMEFIRGKSLRQWLNMNGTCPAIVVADWLGQVCEAAAVAHEHGIVHRDLKPENIMLKEFAADRYIVKVVDFGLAKMVSDEDENGRITKTHEVLGTPYYMAPEFYDGEVVDNRVDVYALGIIAYEMLTGNTPFNGTLENIIAGHLFKPVPSISKIDSNISEELEEVVMKALKKKRDERYATVMDFAVALRNAVGFTPHTLQSGATSLSSLNYKMTPSDTVKRQTTQVKRNEETKHVSGVLQLESDSQEKPVSQVETLVHNSDVYIKTEAVSLKPGQKVYLAAQNLSDGNSEKVSKRVGSDKKLVVGAVVLALLGLGSVATWSMLRTAKQPTISVQPSAVVPPTTASPTPPSSPKNGSTEEIKSSNIDSGKETTSSSEPVSQPKERPDKSTARTDEKIEVDKRKQDDKVKGDVVEDAVLSPRQKNTSRRPAVARAQARRDNKKAEKERKKEEKRGNKKKRRRGVFGTIKDIFD